METTLQEELKKSEPPQVEAGLRGQLKKSQLPYSSEPFGGQSGLRMKPRERGEACCHMKHLIPDREDVAKNEFVVTVRLRVIDETALLGAAYAKIGYRGLLADSSEFGVEGHIAKSRTEISWALAEVLLGHFDNPKSGIEMISAEIDHWHLKEHDGYTD